MNSDIIVVGAGPAGLSFAAAAAVQGLTVTLIEKQPLTKLAKPEYDGREIALTHRSRRIMGELGLWQCVPPKEISLIRDAKVLNGTSSYALHFSADEAGEANLGFMMSNHLIRKAAYEAATAHKSVKVLAGRSVTEVGTDENEAWVKLDNGKRLTGELLIAADSRFSETRARMGITASRHDFKRSCVVCRMEIEGQHDDVAYECFFYDRTLAVLPLFGKHVSVVITLDSKDCPALLKTSAKDFARDIEARMEGRFGRMKLVSKLYDYPLVGMYAKSFYGQRFALMGDAAVGMHPVTAHGYNFGLAGAEVLANEISYAQAEGRGIADPLALRRYHRQHVDLTLPMYLGTNLLVGVFTRTSPSAKLLRRSLLRMGNMLKPAKRLITGRLTEAA